jgi:NDP-sugar pyrophosphorylase family protein
MGNYIFKWSVLREYLIADEADPESENDFGKNIIPNLLKDGKDMYAFSFSGYWKDVGTIPSLWEANMEVLDPEHSGIDLFDDDWKVYSRNSGMTGHKVGKNALVENSMITDGCRINGTVKHSVLFAGVKVEEVIDQLKGIHCQSCAFARAKGNPIDGTSCPDIIAKCIKAAYTPTEVVEDTTEKCPECGQPVRHEGGCKVCDCGWSRCS